MVELFTFLLINLKSFGDLKSVNMYDSTLANIKFESENSAYDIVIQRKDKTCEKSQEEKKDAD